MQMLAGAAGVLQEANCSLIGGHTTEGDTAAMGFAVNGIVYPDQVLPKGPVTCTRYHSTTVERDPNVLVLTKALGTGTLLAADMRARARGRWVAGAIDSMRQSNAAAAKVLKSFDCTACTDITGFGLAGHLLEMLQYESADGHVGSSSSINNDNSDNNSDVGSCRSKSVTLYMDRIPVLDGATECVQQGVLSSLQPQVRSSTLVYYLRMLAITVIQLVVE